MHPSTFTSDVNYRNDLWNRLKDCVSCADLLKPREERRGRASEFRFPQWIGSLDFNPAEM